MKLLLLLLAICVVALVGTAIAVLLHIRRHRVPAENPAPEPALMERD